MSTISKGLQGAALALAVVAAGAQAQGVVNRPQLSAALANELVGESVAICAKQGYKVWAVVVNTDGVRQALLRGDGAPIHSQDNAYYKAYTAASLTLGRNENVTFAQGAIVIRAAGQIIGAIGVSGAPGGQYDEACAKEALSKIQDRIK